MADRKIDLIQESFCYYYHSENSLFKGCVLKKDAEEDGFVASISKKSTLTSRSLLETLVANQTPLMSLPHVGVDFYKKLIQYYKNQNKLPPTFAYLNGISNYIDTRLNKKLNDIDLGLELADMPYTLKDADLVTFDVRKYPGIGPKESKKLPDTGGVTSLDVVSQNYPKRVTKWLDSFGVTT